MFVFRWGVHPGIAAPLNAKDHARTLSRAWNNEPLPASIGRTSKASRVRAIRKGVQQINGSRRENFCA